MKTVEIRRKNLVKIEEQQLNIKEKQLKIEEKQLKIDAWSAI